MKTNQKLQNFTNIISNIFLVCLGLLAFQSIFGQAIFGFEMANYSLGNFILSFIEKVQYMIVILAIMSGALVLSQNKKSLDEIFIRKKETKKHNIFFYFGIIIILGISLFSFSINIENLSFEDDEYFTVSVAKNLHETGKLYQWDFIEDIPGQDSERCAAKDYCKYERSYIYTYAVGLSYKYLGISEFSTRLPGMIFYFLSILSLVFFFILMKFRKRFIIILLLLLAGSTVIFSNFFIARMYGLLIFSSILTYILTVLIYKFSSEKSIKKTIISTLLLVIVIFIGYNSHVNYIIFLGLIFILIFILKFNLFKIYLNNYKKYSIFTKITLLLILSILVMFLFYKLNIYSRFEKFITFRESPGYYIRYFYYTFTSSIGKIGNINIMLLFSGISLFIFFHYSKYKKNILFSLPFFIIISSIILYVYFLDTKLFIANRYVSHLTIFAIIVTAISIFIIGNSFIKRKKLYFYILIYLLLFNGIINLQIKEHNKKSISANYNIGYQELLKDFNKETDIMIGIPIRDYYIKGVGDIIKINASQRFNDYNYNRFLSDLKHYEDKNIYFIYSDIKSFHVNSNIKKYLEDNFEIFSHKGNITIYKIEKNIN